ncbi:hypothetical protein BD626DRAFT_478921 [Schizophyllum amplum]|uniref:Uncharacterized protein n=1 Tax=Schizophyllum amplum TaxID=97359 RepID=A0A550CRP8_9AGAR|nr:hypothetical protein BD626DRAFT_478921 [Auriculariopsis ampla]
MEAPANGSSHTMPGLQEHGADNLILQCRYRPSSDGHEELNIALGCACPEKSELYDLAMTVMHNYMEMLTRLEHAQRLSQSIADVLPHLRLFSLYTYHDGKEWYPEIGFVNMRS